MQQISFDKQFIQFGWKRNAIMVLLNASSRSFAFSPLVHSLGGSCIRLPCDICWWNKFQGNQMQLCTFSIQIYSSSMALHKFCCCLHQLFNTCSGIRFEYCSLDTNKIMCDSFRLHFVINWHLLCCMQGQNVFEQKQEKKERERRKRAWTFNTWNKCKTDSWNQVAIGDHTLTIAAQ